jgi:hypothetical protein
MSLIAAGSLFVIRVFGCEWVIGIGSAREHRLIPAFIGAPPQARGMRGISGKKQGLRKIQVL